MSQDSADVFARRRDTDWEMFCRGRRDDGPSWVDAGSPLDSAGEHASGLDEWLAAPGRNAPVPLMPVGGEHESGLEGQALPPPAGDHLGRPHVRHFHAKVVGVCYPNPDGSSRIGVIRGMRVRELVQFEHRPDNPVDPNAVAVLRPGDGRQLGYLRAALAKGVVAAARRGTRYLALVDEVTGVDGIGGGPVGAVLLVLALEHGATKAMARDYLLDFSNGGRA